MNYVSIIFRWLLVIQHKHEILNDKNINENWKKNRIKVLSFFGP